MADGDEIRLYDPNREPAQWTEILLPTQCAVLLKDATTLRPLSGSGRVFQRVEDATCMRFDRIDSARQFCDATVAKQPNIRCEIFDGEGLAHPPLVVIQHPSQSRSDESGAHWAKRRRAIATVLFGGALVLFWIDWRRGWPSFLPTFFAINMTVAGLRFVYWDFGLRHRERERLKRLDAHRRREGAGLD